MEAFCSQGVGDKQDRGGFPGLSEPLLGLSLVLPPLLQVETRGKGQDIPSLARREGVSPSQSLGRRNASGQEQEGILSPLDRFS